MDNRKPAAAAQLEVASAMPKGAAVTSIAGVFLVLFLTIGVFQLGTGMLMGVVPVQLSLNGYAASVVGWVSTGQAVGFLAGSLCAAPITSRLRARPTLFVFAAINALTAVALWLWSDPLFWTIARVIAGFCSGVVMVLFEAWVGSKATAANRGLVFGIYMVLTRLAFMIAQVAMAVVAPHLTLLFLVAAVCYLAAPGVASIVPGDPPPIGGKSLGGIWDMPRRAPAAASAAFAHAMITTSAMGLFPVYAVARGIPVDQIAFLLAATQFGGLVFQLPMSLLSDRVGRRTVMTIAALATFTMSVVLWLIGPTGVWPLAAMAALWAGAPAALYSLGVAHANDIATDGERVAWAGALISLWGLGAVVGPVLAAALMDRYGVGALFAFTGVLSGGLTAFLAARKLIRKRPTAPIPSAETIGPAPGANG
jgi:MFS family permease